MPVDDRTRLNLHRKLEAVLGEEEADTLMAHLPPVTWHEVATRDDVRTLGIELRAEMAELRAELRDEIAELRTEMRTGSADLGQALRTEIASVRIEMSEAMTRQIRWLVTFTVAWSSMLVAAVSLVG